MSTTTTRALKIPADSGRCCRCCHYCDRRTHYGRFLGFVDGKRRWVCSACEEHMAIDEAQEQEQD